ncbi:MAG: UDP-N-acetylmuramoyl-L-alanyl-D-glutamate--2,6-diaminopimelate ligase [Kiritimatiellaeota bacterium]|nr:UDP-N-acetylmuramoyl-L-alanyl-D-glutamate--2,6-diaminopimelate ligase [Kiritimatiellota bacterium]
MAQPFRNYLEALGELLLTVRGEPGTPIRGAVCDSREVLPGCLFVAVRGSKEDGLCHLSEARRRGAVALIAAALPADLPPAFPVAVVSDTYAAAARVAEVLHGSPARELQVVAVTGTNGKTTTVMLLQAILAAAGRTPGLISTVRYETPGGAIAADRTTPPPFLLQRLLARMRDQGADTVVMEVSSHALAQNRLGRTRPRAALFTHLTPEHQDYHAGMDRYFAAKARLFVERLAPAGLAVIGTDGPFGRKLLERLRRERSDLQVVGFGTGQWADARLAIDRASLEGLRCRLHFPGCVEALALASPLIGRFNAMNIAGAATLAAASGVSFNVIADAVRGFRGAPGRMQAVYGPARRLVVVDYAHTDDALAKALGALRELGPRRVIVVFGCGGDRDRSKRPRMGRVAADLADLTVLTNDNPRTEAPAAILSEIRSGMPECAPCVVEPDRRKAIRRALEIAEPADVVLVAGKGHETYQLIGDRCRPFDDVAEVRAAFSTLFPSLAPGAEGVSDAEKRPERKPEG